MAVLAGLRCEPRTCAGRSRACSVPSRSLREHGLESVLGQVTEGGSAIPPSVPMVPLREVLPGPQDQTRCRLTQGNNSRNFHVDVLPQGVKLLKAAFLGLVTFKYRILRGCRVRRLLPTPLLSPREDTGRLERNIHWWSRGLKIGLPTWDQSSSLCRAAPFDSHSGPFGLP